MCIRVPILMSQIESFLVVTKPDPGAAPHILSAPYCLWRCGKDRANAAVVEMSDLSSDCGPFGTPVDWQREAPWVIYIQAGKTN
jgi:hypothetical protein